MNYCDEDKRRQRDGHGRIDSELYLKQEQECICRMGKALLSVFLFYTPLGLQGAVRLFSCWHQRARIEIGPLFIILIHSQQFFIGFEDTLRANIQIF